MGVLVVIIFNADEDHVLLEAVEITSVVLVVNATDESNLTSLFAESSPSHRTFDPGARVAPHKDTPVTLVNSANVPSSGTNLPILLRPCSANHIHPRESIAIP